MASESVLVKGKHHATESSRLQLLAAKRGKSYSILRLKETQAKQDPSNMDKAWPLDKPIAPQKQLVVMCCTCGEHTAA